MIGIGLVGAGNMARVLLKELLAENTANNHTAFEVKGVVDPDHRSVTALNKLLETEVQVYQSVDELYNNPEIQWVYIASWNKDHAEQVIKAFQAGKHVFCQKPIATNFEDAIAMYRAWQQSNCHFSIGFSLRYTPHYRKIKEIVASGILGKIISFEFNETLDFNHGGYIMGDWRRLTENAGTHLLEKCCHDIDIANWLIESRVAKVASFGGLNFFVPENECLIEKIGQNNEGKQAYRTWGGLVALNPFTSDKDIIDHQVAILSYQNGVKATFHTNCNASIPERRMYILGSEGTLRADIWKGIVEVKRIGFDTELIEFDTRAEGSHGGGDNMLAKELVAMMTTGQQPSVGFMAGLESALVCFAIDTALTKEQVVSVQYHDDGR